MSWDSFGSTDGTGTGSSSSFRRAYTRPVQFGPRGLWTPGQLPWVWVLMELPVWTHHERGETMLRRKLPSAVILFKRE